MIQLGKFLLVLMGVSILSLWVLVRMRSIKLFLLIIAACVGWIVLPTLLMQTEWGYYKESGSRMGWWVLDKLDGEVDEIGSRWAFVAAICGDTRGFDKSDLLWFRGTAMPEQPELKHFFYSSSFTSVAWLGVGSKERFCLARYRFKAWRDYGLPSFPSQVYPYPFMPRMSDYHVRPTLIERLPPPRSSDPGVRALAPGECATGQIAPGETLRFEVRMPYFDQPRRLYHGWCGCEERLTMNWSRNGQLLKDDVDPGDGVGTYQIVLASASDRAQGYDLAAYWGDSTPYCGRWTWKCDCDDPATPKPPTGSENQK